ncbi:MAG: radical SAM protein [Chloroflexi bacterium]|nr:radical SAM protein [Chloroflexota bacterium]MBP8054662.1 radical SAM protein [Chloroflexota bacterium]
MSEAALTAYLRQFPPSINTESIRAQWQALAPTYHVDHWLLPLPLWGRRPLDQLGPDAWHHLRHYLSHYDTNNPFCLYLHVPFCTSKCHFCDCYSFKLRSHQTQQCQNYVDRLCEEIQLWSQQGNLNQRPVSTVHWGGGTPTFLSAAALTQLTTCCRTHFHITPKTEWALESTVQGLTPEMIHTLHQIGYRRLHLGVQSLEESVRQKIGRRQPVKTVLHTIAAMVALGWVVSVDMVCGLPSQTATGFIADLETLIALGVNGFSLYELLIYPQNRRWAEAQGLAQRSHLDSYCLFQAGAALLQRYGFQHNLFNHWADTRDKNLYFTFPTRREDCLALGTIADGVLGDYHFRHPPYAAYMRTCRDGQPGLQGGLWRTSQETALLPLTTAILSGTIPSHIAAVFQTIPMGETNLLAHWQQHQFIEASREKEGFCLTANGAWFAGNMVKTLAGLTASNISHIPAKNEPL